MNNSDQNVLMACLQPDLIYRFNQTFLTAWRQGDIGNVEGEEIPFTLSYFNSQTRTFNWISIGEKLWDRNSEEWSKEEEENTVNALIKIIKKWNLPDKELQDEDENFNTSYCTRKKTWEGLWNEFPKSGIYNTAEEICKGERFDGESRERLQRAMLGLYSGINFDAEKNIEGIFVGYLKELEKPVKDQQTNYLSGTLKNFREDTKDQTAPFDWLVLDSEFVSGSVSGSGLKQYQNIRDSNPCSSFGDEQKNPKNINPPKAEGIQKLGEVFFTKLLLEPDNSDFGTKLAERIYMVLVPIYDVWIDKKELLALEGERAHLPVCGFGCIKAVVLCFFKEERRKKKWLGEKLPPLLSQLSTVSSAIIESSKAQALSQPITPPYDLLRHFLSVLTYVQDWESAYVVDTTKTYVPFYYERDYERQKESDSPIVDWTERVETNNIHMPCDPSTIQCKECKDGKRFFMWWTNDHWDTEERSFNLWSKDLIYSLGDEERNAFSRFAIRFEFPEACYLPADTDLQKQMRNAYLRQQLDLMNLLIPKVQTRRAALRSAVSAIMGRNMSHNIGSHVIARYAAVAGSTGDPSDPNDTGEQRNTPLERNVEDHRAVFLRYLQRRMDFIAEISTSDKPNWSQPLGLVEVLAALNFKKEKERITKDSESFNPILLSYITGKEGIKASVEVDSDIKEYFNCPSGEVGVHALYVILENIIRNSARHNTNLGNEVRLEVEVTDSAEYPELLKLEITDCQTEKEEECGESLDKRINNIISKESFLNPDGSPNPQYWGIREMLICAQHLRGLSLSDLETPLFVGPPILEAFKKKENGENGESRLAYRLYLQRAKLIALVTGNELCETLQSKKPELQSRGIALFSELAGNYEEIRGYGFVVLPKEMESKLSEEDKLRLPVRKRYDDCFIECLLGAIKKDKIKTEQWLESLHRYLWKTYLDKRCCWKDKSIKALVGWDCPTWTGEGNDVVKESSFSHMLINDGDADSPYQQWGKRNLKKDKDRGLVWVDHANAQRFCKTKSPNLVCAAIDVETTRETVPQPIIFAEIIESQSPHKPVLEAQKKGNTKGNELIAAALARVIVLDERVQSEIKKDYRKIPYNILWPCMGIWTPDAEKCDLNSPDLGKIKCFLDNPTKKKQLPADFLVLHLTILESLAMNKKTKQKILEELRECNGVGDHCEVVIVSGRGVPSATLTSDSENGKCESSNERFLPISALLEYLVSRPSKLALMRSLWSA